MPVVNAEIASKLDQIADFLDIEGANPFRARAYRRAARLIGELRPFVSLALRESFGRRETAGSIDTYQSRRTEVALGGIEVWERGEASDP